MISIRGAVWLLRTEHSIMVQSAVAMIFICLGFYFQISKTEWMIQMLVTGNVLAIEGLNSAVEKLCDFVHPGYHAKIGKIKDISSGAVAFVVLVAVVMAILIYGPRFVELFPG